MDADDEKQHVVFCTSGNDAMMHKNNLTKNHKGMGASAKSGHNVFIDMDLQLHLARYPGVWHRMCTQNFSCKALLI
jgi:hypothetical protein